MLDAKSKTVLKVLEKECINKQYKILDIEDILLLLPKRFKMDKQNLKHILFYLERQNIISIKYDEDDVFCIAILPYGYEILENETEQKNIITKQKKEKSKFWFTGIHILISLINLIINILLLFYIVK